MSLLDALKASQDRNTRDDRAADKQKHDSLVKANQALGMLGMGMPAGVGMGLQALTDMQIDALEKKNPSLAPRNPFDPKARNRFSTVGQVVLGLGYPTQVGIPSVSVVDRIRGVFGGNTAPDPRTTMFNARGNVFNILGGGNQVQPTVGSGWETSGGDGPNAPSQGTTNFGGRESAVGMDDMSGYA